MYDLVVRGGTVIDGSGSAGIRADVGVRDGRIVEVGRIGGRGREEVDAEGHVVSPGFVDGHTHMDAQVFWDELGTSSCWQGVTTVVMGHCGFTLAPARADRRELVVRNLNGPRTSPGRYGRGDQVELGDLPGVPRRGRPAPEGDQPRRQPRPLGVAHLGHGRASVRGGGFDDELDEMARVLREALEAGAMGFTTTRNTFHQTSDGRPVASRWRLGRGRPAGLRDGRRRRRHLPDHRRAGGQLPRPRGPGGVLPTGWGPWRWRPGCPSPSGSRRRPQGSRRSTSSTPPWPRGPDLRHGPPGGRLGPVVRDPAALRPVGRLEGVPHAAS